MSTIHITFPKRPLLCGKPITDEEIHNSLNELGTPDSTFSFIF